MYLVLHSFPTRRSSDLDFDAELRITDAAGHVFSQSRLSVPSGTSQHVMDTHDLPAGIYFIMMQSDRKSTRLNSSHSQISYAVFCLKNKKYINRLASHFF